MPIFYLEELLRRAPVADIPNFTATPLAPKCIVSDQMRDALGAAINAGLIHEDGDTGGSVKVFTSHKELLARADEVIESIKDDPVFPFDATSFDDFEALGGAAPLAWLPCVATLSHDW